MQMFLRKAGGFADHMQDHGALGCFSMDAAHPTRLVVVRLRRQGSLIETLARDRPWADGRAPAPRLSAASGAGLFPEVEVAGLSTVRPSGPT